MCTFLNKMCTENVENCVHSLKNCTNWIQRIMYNLWKIMYVECTEVCTLFGNLCALNIQNYEKLLIINI